MLAADASLGFVYGTMAILAPDGSDTGRTGGMSPPAICAADGTDDPLVSLVLHNFVPAPSVMMRRALFEELGGFDTRFYYVDWELWVRMLARAGVGWADGPPVAGYRIHGHALTQEDADRDLPRRLDFYRALAVEAAAQGRLAAPRLRALVSLQRAATAAELGEVEEARAAVATALADDSAAARDRDFLLWFLARLQRRHVRGGDGSGWLPRYLEPRSAPAEIAAAGAATGHLGFWILDAARDRVAAESLDAVVWALVANELEAGVHRPRRQLVHAVAARLVARPQLATERSFVKIALCSAGAWPVAVRARGWMVPAAHHPNHAAILAGARLRFARKARERAARRS